MICTLQSNNIACVGIYMHFHANRRLETNSLLEWTVEMTLICVTVTFQGHNWNIYIPWKLLLLILTNNLTELLVFQSPVSFNYWSSTNFYCWKKSLLLSCFYYLFPVFPVFSRFFPRFKTSENFTFLIGWHASRRRGSH